MMAALVAALATAVSCGNNKKVNNESEAQRTLMTIEELNGTWNVTELAGAALEEGKAIEINFDTPTFAATAGCNIISGEVSQSSRAADAISFTNMLSTMMLCPDEELESLLKESISKICSFYGKGENTVAFTDMDDQIVILATKSE